MFGLFFVKHFSLSLSLSLCVCVCVCPNCHLSASLAACLPIPFLPVWLTTYQTLPLLSVCLSVCRIIRGSLQKAKINGHFGWCVVKPIYMAWYMFIFWSIGLSNCLFVWLSVCLSRPLCMCMWMTFPVYRLPSSKMLLWINKKSLRNR